MQQANIGASVIEAQYIKRMSTAQLANILGETRQSFYHLRKQKSAGIHKVQKLAGIFEMPLVDFINLGFRND